MWLGFILIIIHLYLSDRQMLVVIQLFSSLCFALPGPRFLRNKKLNPYEYNTPDFAGLCTWIADRPLYLSPRPA
jgi:hypothetical protein